MKACLLFLLGCLVFGGCYQPKVASDGLPETIPATTPSFSSGPLYLAQRVAVATEESLYGLRAGTELKLIEERPGGLVVEAEGMQFEIDPRLTTRDGDLARALLDRTNETKAIPPVTTLERWQIEDRRFLAEENVRRSATEEAHLLSGVDQPKR